MDTPEILLVPYPKPWLLFWGVMLICYGYMDYAFFRKWRSWKRGERRPLPEVKNRARIIKIWLAEVLFQRQLLGLSFFRWLAHIFVFWGFIGLAALSLSTFLLRPLDYLGIDGGLADFIFRQEGHLVAKVWGDAFGLALLLGLVLALFKRVVVRPARQSSAPMDTALLGALLWLTLSGFALEGVRLSPAPPELAQYSFVGRFFIPPGMHEGEHLKTWMTMLWTAHGLSAAFFIAYLPHSKLLHSLLAPLVIALNAVEEQEREDLYWPDIRKHRATGSPED